MVMVGQQNKEGSVLELTHDGEVSLSSKSAAWTIRSVSLASYNEVVAIKAGGGLDGGWTGSITNDDGIRIQKQRGGEGIRSCKSWSEIGTEAGCRTNKSCLPGARYITRG